MNIPGVFAVGIGVVALLCAPIFLYAETNATNTPVGINNGIEARVREYFSQIPVMAEIARCESKFRQFNVLGDPLDGGAGGMIGVFQINSRVHREYAKSLGMDIYTLEGNLAYAKLLYENEGTNPWRSSSSCWGSDEAEIARLQALIVELTAQLNALKQKLALS